MTPLQAGGVEPEWTAALAVATVAVGVALVEAGRRRGAAYLGAYLLTVGVGVGTGAVEAVFGLSLPPGPVLLDRPLWLALSLLGDVDVVAPVPFLLFALAYTGRTDLVTRRGVAALSVPVVVVVVTTQAATLGLVGVRYNPGTEPVWLRTLWAAVGPLRQVYVVGYLLGGVGLLLYGFDRQSHLSVWTGVALSGGVLVDLLRRLAVLQTPGRRALTAGLETATLLALVVPVGYLLARGRLFGSGLAASTVGRESAVRQIEQALLVVDDDGRVVEANDRAIDLFDAARERLVGGALDAALVAGGAEVDADRVLSGDCDEFVVGSPPRRLRPSVSELRDQHGGSLGRLVLLYDVTEQRRREQRVAVLNRVLRHNLRNELSAVDGYAEVLADGGTPVEPAEIAERIRSATSDLVSLGAGARELESVLEAPPRTEAGTDAAALVRSVVDERAEEHPETRFTVDAPDAVETDCNPAVLRRVVDALVDNAAAHNEGDERTVEVEVTVDERPTPGREESVRVRVADDGPGIPDHEREVVERGEETQLEHGSGLGLWLAKWGAGRLGGDLEFVSTSEEGTTVEVHVPR